MINQFVIKKTGKIWYGILGLQINLNTNMNKHNIYINLLEQENINLVIFFYC